MTDTPKPSASSDLPTRVVMAVVMIAVAGAAIYYGGWPFRLLVVAGAAVMLLEWADMHRVSRRWGYIGAGLLVANLLVLPELLFPVAEMDAAISTASFAPAWLGFGGTALLGLLMGLVSRRLTMAGGYLYIAIPAIALLVLNWAWFALVFWVMVVTWATDIFAYFAGRAIGGPKLAPRISPNKTWAGLVGGMAGAAAFGWLAAWYFEMGTPFIWIGAIMGFFAQGGDLYESWLKRRAGVKDSGTILPGHGGALDRLDGLLAVVVATFLVVASGQWVG